MDTDVGVDLYCETVEQDIPFLHFWVQVKAGIKQCRILGEGECASCSFGINHLKYWHRQPVPVYAALVPVDWPVSTEPYVYIINLSDKLIDGIQSTGNTITLQSDLVWPPGDKNAIRSFLRNIVPQSTARLFCKSGVVASEPTFHPEYVQSFPVVPVTRFSDHILSQVRRTAAFSIIFMYHQKEFTDENKGFRRKLDRILEAFDEEQNWENFMARALSFHSDEDFESACIFYQKAIDCILSDKQVASHAYWQKIVYEIDQLKQMANTRKPLKAG